jgi:hypothetical protein
MDALVKRCEHCNETVSESKRGRPQRFCSDKCRQAHRKIGSTAEKWPEVPDRPSEAKNGFGNPCFN